MKSLLVFATLALVLILPTTTFAESKSQALLKQCEDLYLLVDKSVASHKKGEDILYGAGYCLGLVKGMFYGMTLFAAPEEDYKACAGNIGPKDYLKTVMQHLRSKPYDNDEDAVTVATALYLKYRCK